MSRPRNVPCSKCGALRVTGQPCKTCETARIMAWQAANKEKVAASKKRYRESLKGQKTIDRYNSRMTKKRRDTRQVNMTPREIRTGIGIATRRCLTEFVKLLEPDDGYKGAPVIYEDQVERLYELWRKAKEILKRKT